MDAAGIAADRKAPLFRSFNRKLQLTARRYGRTTPVYRACPRLRALLTVTGVGDIVPEYDSCAVEPSNPEEASQP